MTLAKTNSEATLLPVMDDLRIYSPPKAYQPIDLRLDSNEGRPPPESLLQEVARAGAELVCRYPDSSGLERQIAGIFGVDKEQVLVTAGGDDAIERLMRAVLGPGREMVLHVPTFEMIDRYAGIIGCEAIRIPWMKGAFPIEKVLGAVTDRTALISVVTPNNPTGLFASASDLERLSREAPQAVLLVDLAYAEFADEDLTEVALSLPNAVALRTMSKAFGLAGLRVGWALGPKRLIEWMRAIGHPYAVSSLSLKLASARLETGGGEVNGFVADVRKERDALTALLERLGAEAIPSQGNFVLTRVDDAKWLFDGLAGMGISVRIFPGKEYLERCARISLPGDSRDFDRLTRSIETLFSPQAILFDLDDTLADVTESYRTATVATAAHFGAKVSFEDIASAKAKGNATNDWELTWRLISAQGKEASLQQVTDRFEALYQGTKNEPGMRSKETLLVGRDLLERLAGRFKLGIVTGRPRSDALAFLDEHSIADLFGAVVTMDDALSKPDPEPVRVALERLAVDRAWMIGDTPDDVRAARSAGVLPLGVIAPADDPDAARTALLGAGAARVIRRISELEELLP